MILVHFSFVCSILGLERTVYYYHQVNDMLVVLLEVNLSQK